MFKILFFILLYVSLSASEHRVLFHGLSHHFDRTDKLGRSWNEKNYGLGYEYSSYDKGDNFYYTSSINILKDSNFEPFYFATLGGEFRPDVTNDYFAVTLNALVGLKMIPLMSRVNGVYVKELSREYKFMGGVTPGFRFYLPYDISIAYNYFPQFEMGSLYVAGFHYMSLGYKF